MNSPFTQGTRLDAIWCNELNEVYKARIRGLEDEIHVFSKIEAFEHIPLVARDWCLKRPEKVLTKDIQLRWGMDEAQHILSSETTGEQEEQNFIYDNAVNDLGER